MGTAWIFMAFLLIGAIIESSSALKQLFKATTIAVPISSSASQSRRFNTTKRNARAPQYNPTQSPFSTTILPTSNTGSYRHLSSVVHEPHKYYEPNHPHRYALPIPLTASPNNWSINRKNPALQHDPVTLEIVSDRPRFSGASAFVQSGSNFPIINHDSYMTHPNNRNVKYADSNAQSTATMIPNFHYHKMQSDSSGVSHNVLPTFSPSLEKNLGQFKPFPPFKFGRGSFLFSGINQGLPNDPVASSSLDNSGSPNPKTNFELLNENFMARPHEPFGYSNQFNTYNKNGFGTSNGHYQPLSAQPQLHFHPSQSAHGEVVNQIDLNQSSGRGGLGSAEGGIKNSFIGGNFGNSHPMTPFANSASFEVPGSSIFNDYDKTFGKYATGAPALPTNEKVTEQYDDVTHGADGDKDGNDEKSGAEYRSDESSSVSHERYKDEEEAESHYKERRGINSRKKDEEHGKTQYPIHDSSEGCGKGAFSPRENDSHESTKSHQKTSLPAKTSAFGHKMPRRRPSRFASHESGPEATQSKHVPNFKSI